MLPKKYRLVREKDFKQILAKGRSFFSPLFRLKYLANSLDFSRLAVIVSLQVSKKATVRNRLKRQVREIFRLNLAKIKPGNDLVIYLKNKALDKDYHQLEKEILAGLFKLKLLR